MKAPSDQTSLLYHASRFSDFLIEQFPEDQEVLLYDKASGNTHRLNNLTLNILTHLASHTLSFDTLLQWQQQQEQSLASQDLSSLLEQLIEVGLVETTKH